MGHTDERDVGTGANLAQLSQQRARAVAEVFAAQGVPAGNIEYQGAGDTQPIASNATDQGRQDNARVQIVDLPNTQDLKQYASQRTANPANFITAHATAKANAPDTQSDPPFGMETIATAPAGNASAATSPHAVAASPNLPTLPVPKAVQSSSHRPTLNSSQYGFEGTPLNPNYQVNLGTSIDHSVFDFMTAAHADTSVVIGSCLNDRPHESTEIKNLATGATLDLDEAVPGLYGQPLGRGARQLRGGVAARVRTQGRNGTGAARDDRVLCDAPGQVCATPTQRDLQGSRQCVPRRQGHAVPGVRLSSGSIRSGPVPGYVCTQQS